MRKKLRLRYIFIFLALLGVMSLPKDSSEKLRGSTAAILAPQWHHLLAMKTFIAGNTEGNAPSDITIEELQRLRLENTLLRTEITHLKDMMLQELKVLSHLSSIDAQKTVSFLKKRHRLELQNILELQLQAIPAHVIFRSPTSWNSSLWIDVGTDTNLALGKTIIAKNSPVLVGTSIVGVVDYIGKKQARVRLITDSGLNPSVRAVRGSTQNHLFKEKLQDVAHLLEKRNTLLASPQEQDDLRHRLEKASEQLSGDGEAWYLAKGEIQGSSKPLWRTNRQQLKGIGFNYDFSDSEGPARDLRTGKPIDTTSKESAISILKAGDILITTGLDGVFPPGLFVAEVSSVQTLKEGDYYYELDARPTAGNLDALTLVFVIPPIGYDPEEKPSLCGWE